MGKFFEAYKIYYNNLSESKVGNAVDLSKTCNDYFNTIKNTIIETNNSHWSELGKFFVLINLRRMANNISTMNSFINNNLLEACKKADALYLKILEIKNKEDSLESKESHLSSLQSNLSSLKSQLSKIKSTGDVSENNKISSLNNNIGSLQNLINSVQADIENIKSSLNILCEEANILINEILQLDGSSLESINNIITNIKNEISVSGNTIQDFNYFDNKVFLEQPYTKWPRAGNVFLVNLASGSSFTVYQQTDAKNYNTANWHNHLRNNINLRFSGNNPLGGGCSGFAISSALSYLLNIPFLDPGIGFYGGGMWGGIKEILNGEEVLEIVDPETKRLNHYTLKSDFKFADYTGDRFGLSSPEKFKQDIYDTFEKKGAVILNSTASGFASPDGQHFVTLIGTDENGYVIIADSMYTGRGVYALNSLDYDPNLPYSVDNCPPYFKFNKSTGEPFKVEDLVDYLIENSDGTNSYCAVSSANLEFLEEAKINEKYQKAYNELVGG